MPTLTDIGKRSAIPSEMRLHLLRLRGLRLLENLRTFKDIGDFLLFTVSEGSLPDRFFALEWFL